jgi:hypothetical protein
LYWLLFMNTSLARMKIKLKDMMDDGWWVMGDGWEREEQKKRRECFHWILFCTSIASSKVKHHLKGYELRATIYDTETISQGRQTAGRIFNNQYP